MRINSTRIRGFGCIVDRVFELPRDRAALVIADNEHGKSTLAAAITAGLCGFPRSTRASKPRGIWRPWTGDDYAVELRLEARGRELIVERDFGRDKLVVRDAATNRDVSADFEEDLTASLLKLPRDDFLRIAVILGKEVHRFDSSVSLKSRLAELLEGSKNANAEAAIAAIEGARYTLGDRSLKIESAIKRLEESLSNARLEMSRLDAQIDAAETEIRQYEGLRQSRDELTDRISILDAEYGAARLAEVREHLTSAREEAEAVGKLRVELNQLARFSGFPVGRADQLTSAITRRGDAESRLGDITSRIRHAEEDAARVQAVLGQGRQFATATEQDVVGLGAYSLDVENTQKTLAAAREKFETSQRRGRGAVWTVVAAAGSMGAAACLVAIILKRLNTQTGAFGAVLSGLVGIVGLVLLLRGWRRRSELQARLNQALELYDSATARVTRLLSALGVSCSGDDLAAIAQRTQCALSMHLADRKRAVELRVDIESLEREASDARKKIADEDRTIRDIFDEAKIDPLLPITEARKRFDEGIEYRRRCDEIRESLLPALEARLITAEEMAQLEAHESELASVVGKAKTDRSPTELDSLRQSARQALDVTTNRLRELESRIGNLVQNYRAQYPALQEEEERLRAELTRASRFERALEVAGRTLSEVAESTRRRWAAALNDRAAVILPHLNPDYDTLLFDDQLDFTVRRIADDRVIDKTLVDTALSTGAKDQVYLAARLACVKELSVDESVPIILDDAFIAFDDHRFQTALRYIVEEIAPHQQVILLSCHRSRHDKFLGDSWLRDRVEVIRL